MHDTPIIIMLAMHADGTNGRWHIPAEPKMPNTFLTKTTALNNPKFLQY